MPDELKDVLAVLDLTTEKEQRTALADLGHKEILYTCASLADLAFRLTREPSGAYREALKNVHNYLWHHGKNDRAYVSWLELDITAIDRIVAALIAKMTKEQ